MRTLLSILFLLSALLAKVVLTPDGNYVDGDTYVLTPAGNYVSGKNYQLAPDGQYISDSSEQSNYNTDTDFNKYYDDDIDTQEK